MSAARKTPKRVLADLQTRLRTAQSPILDGLRPGSSPAEVTRVLGALGAPPDPFLVALYSWHDGAAGGGPSAELMDIARFLSLDEAIKTREVELQLAAEVESLPDTPAAKIFDPGWFPLLTDPSGRVYVVEDCGRGKVLIIDRMAIDSPDELSPSLVDFFDRLARDGMDYKPPPLSADAAVLVSRLESNEPGVRVKASNELVRKRPGDAFEPLVALLESDDHEVRREAALILGELRDTRAIPILIRCVARWTGPDVASAWGGLLAIGKESPLEHLEKALTEAEPELRMHAIQGLIVSRDARAVPALQAAALRDSDDRVRAAAQQAIRSLSEPR